MKKQLLLLMATAFFVSYSAEHRAEQTTSELTTVTKAPHPLGIYSEVVFCQLRTRNIYMLLALGASLNEAEINGKKAAEEEFNNMTIKAMISNEKTRKAIQAELSKI